MDFHSTYDDLFAPPDPGLARLSSGELVVFTAADAGALRVNPAVSHQGLEHATAVAATTGQSYPMEMTGLRRLFEPSTFVKSGAEHRPGKQLLSHVMSPRAVSQLRDSLGAEVRRALDEGVERGEIELRSALAEPVVAAFWQAAVGFEPEATQEYVRLSTAITDCFRTWVTQEQLVAADQAAAELVERVPAHLARNAKGGRFPFLNDLIARVGAMDGPDRPADPYAMLAAAMLDGFATLAATQTVLAYSLLDAGVQPADHQADPSFATNAFMEAMRLNSPVAMIVRRAIEDIEHDGLFIPRGTDFIMLWAVSCRDPRAFSDPNQFVLDRGTRTSQFTFGGGPYICGGRNVARIVGETLAAEMASGGFALEFAGEPTLIHDRTGRDVTTLPVRVSKV